MSTRTKNRNGFFNRFREALSQASVNRADSRNMGIEPLEGRIAPAAVITVTLNDNNTGSVNPGDTINYTEIIAHGAGSDADALNLQIAHLINNANFVPGSLNISPLAFNDAFTAIGNTHLYVGSGPWGGSTPAKSVVGNLFANDLEFANDLGVQDTFALASYTQPAQAGSSVTVNADGSFIYLPAAGFTGTDTFTYTITDDGVGGVGALSTTATVTITVGEAVWYVDDSAAAGGDGRSNSPLQSLAPLHTGGAKDGLDNADDIIFVYGGSYSGTLTLEAGQKLISQSSNLVVDGVTLVSTTTSRPTISNNNGVVLTLASGNEVRGFNLTNSAGGGITGSNVGTLLLSDLDVTVTGGTALNLTGSGTVTLTGSDNDLSATNGTALNVADVTISAAGMTFKSISASGGTNGIVLQNTGLTAGLTVTGVGTTANSGGIIKNTTGDGIVLQNTKNVSFNGIRLLDTGRHGIFGNDVDGFRLTNSTIVGAGDADEENGIQFGQDNSGLGPVTTVGVKGTVLIQDTTIDNATQWGLRVYNNSDSAVLNMTLQRLTVQNNIGTFGENAVSLRFEDGTANVLVDDSDFINNDAGFSAQTIGFNGAVMNVTIQNSTFDENRSLPSAINFTTGGNTTGRLKLQNNTISGHAAGTESSTLIDLDASDTSTLHAIITNNTGFDTGIGGALEFVVNDNATGRAEVRNNTFTLTGSNKTGMLFRARTVAPENNETGSLDITLANNTINNLNSTGAVASGFQIDAGNSGTSPTHANTIRLNVSTAHGAGNNVVNGVAMDGFTFDFITRQRIGTTFILQGYTGSPSDTAAIAAFFDANNPNGTHNPSGSDTFVGTGGTHIVNYTGGTAQLPVVPTLPPTPLFLAPGEEVSPTEPGSGDGTVPGIVDDGLLSQTELDSLVAAAKARWIASGLSPEQIALLDSITFEVADLGGRTLGLTSGTHFTLDNDGAGAGWFVDATPEEDSEFSTGALVSRLDALTAVMHEMGHVLGLEDTYDFEDSSSVMYGFLTFDTRRAPVTGEAIGATPHNHSSPEYVFSPINIAKNGAGASVPITLPLGKTLTLNYSATVPTSTIATSVSAQATVTGTGINVVSNDPTTVAANDATITPINLPDVKVELLTGASVTEDGSGTLVYTFTREGATDFARTINFNVGGSATFASDYTQSGAGSFTTTGGTVTFAEGQSTVTVTLTPIADSTVEANETAVLTVAAGAGYDVGTPAAATGTILNDDTDVKVELLSGTSVAEDGAPNLVYTFTRTGVTTGTHTVNFSLTGAASLTSSDYAILAAAGITFDAATGLGTVTFNAGETTKTVTLDPTADNVVEADEVATLTVMPGTGYNVAGSPAAGTISNDDADVKVELLSGTSVTEDGTPNLVYTFTRTGLTSGTHTVNFSVTGAASLTSSDYAILAAAGITFDAGTGLGTVTFNAGETTKTVTLNPTADSVVESDEVATLTVTPGTGYNVIGSPASGTILNDDTDVKVELLSGTSVAEDGAPNLVYTFTRTGLTTGTHTVNFSVTGTASLTSSDYAILAASGVVFDPATGLGTVTFNAGETTKTVTLDPTADAVLEGNENAVVTVLNGTGYNVSGSPATGTILNDDTDVKVELLSGTSVAEDGAPNLVYTFTRTGVTTGTHTVNFSLTGSASLTSSDYAILAAAGITFDAGTGLGTVTFNAGETTKTVTLDPTADNVVEADEVATLTVKPGTGYNVAGSPAAGTISNDDADVSLSISPASVEEDGAGNLIYTFTRTGYTGSALTVGFNVGGTATHVTDYAQSGAASFGSGVGTITFAPGVDTVTVTIDPVADTDGEPDETVALTLTGGAGYNVATSGTITGTIRNDDTAVTVAVGTASLAENASGGFVYTFSRTGDTSTDLLVSFNIGGTAAFTSDYTAAGHASFNGVTGTVLIPAGAASAAITLTPVNDRAVEGNETAVLTVVNGPSYGAGVANTATGTITDNDFATVSLVNNTSSVGEGAGTHNVGVQLVITADGTGTPSLEREVKVNLSDLLSGSAAGAGVDYSFSSPRTVTFASGATASTQNVAVTLVNDARVEGNETIALQLGTLVDGTAGQVSLSGNANHTVTITDNDFATVSLVNNTSSVGEGAGTHNVGVQLVITADGTGTPSLEREVKVNLSDLLSGSAAGAGVDYSFSSPRTVTFASGATASTQNVAVTLVNDARVEGNETIALQLGTLVDGTAGQVSLTGNANHTVTITDNDFATVSLVNNTSSVGEGAGTHNVGVQLVITADGTGTPSLEREVKVNLSDLLSGSAAGAGVDYSFSSPRTVTFASGATASTQNVAVTLVNDARVEGNETIALQLGTLVDGTAGQVSLSGNANHTVTITDNDFATVSLVNNTSSVGEGAGTHNVGVQLVITADGTGTPSLEREVKVNLSDLLSGSAAGAGAGADYSFSSPRTVTFASGATASTQNVAVTLVNDARVEGNETIALQLGTLVDGTSGQVSLSGNANHTVTITDNDFATISFQSSASNTGEAGGTHNVGVTLLITADGTGVGTLERAVSVNVADLLSGSASGAGVDYTFSSPQTVVFASGETSSTKNVQVFIANDLLSEGNESINLELNSLTHNAGSQITLGASTSHAVTIVDNDVDLRVTKTESVETVIAGSGAGNLTYTVTVKNIGLTNATGVVIAENLTLPAGVSILSVTPSAGSFTLTSSPDGNWSVGNLAVGGEVTLTVVLTVDASAAEGLDVISNTASLTAADQVIVNLVDDVASQSTSVDRQVDLQITKDDSVTTITPGETLAYVLNVKNAGPSNATGVVIIEILPAGTTFNAGASTVGWTEVAPGSGVFVLNLGTVAGDSSAAPVTFAVNVLYPAETGLHTVENTATVTDDSTAGADLNVADNTAQDSNLLDASPELSLTVTDDISATVARGGLVRYTLTYANTGSQNTTGVYLLENVPANATFDPFASDGNWVLQQDGSYRLDVGDLAAGGVPQSVIFAVRVNTTVPAGIRELVNTALIDDSGNDSLEDLSVSATEHTLHYQGIYVVAPGITLPKKGAPAIVRVFDIATDTELSSFVAYENYKDSVRVAVGDFNGDGFDDVVTSSRLGSGQVRVFDGFTGERLPIGEQLQLDPFNGKKDKGAYIAVGDVTGDGLDDIIVGSALGGSKVKIYNGLTGGLVNEYDAFAKSYRGGVRLAVADVDGDGIDDVVAGQGNFGRTARVFGGASDTLLQQIEVGGKNYRGGISVAAADVNGDGKADIITGRSGKSAPWVEIFSGEDQSSLGRFLAFDAKFRNGIRIAAADVNVDGIADIIVGAGYKGGSQVRIFDGSSASGFAEIHNFVAFPSYPDVSLFVAGTSPVPIIANQQQIPV